MCDGWWLRHRFAKYAGDKNIVIVPGDHNAIRPPFFHHSAAIFLKTTMQIPDEVTTKNVHCSVVLPGAAVVLLGRRMQESCVSMRSRSRRVVSCPVVSCRAVNARS